MVYLVALLSDEGPAAWRSWYLVVVDKGGRGNLEWGYRWQDTALSEVDEIGK